MITLREATLDDVTGIVYVQATTWIDHYPNPAHHIEESDIRNIDWRGKLTDWQHMIKSDQYQVLVMAQDRNIYGFLASSGAPDKLTIESLYVLPEHQHQGIGSQLLERSLAGVRQARAHVASYSENTIAFYNRHGFKPDNTYGVHHLPGGKKIPTLQLRYQDSNRADKQVTRQELAHLAGVRPSTLKWYSEIGLLEFMQSEAGRRRYYDPDATLVRLREIRRLRDDGFSIDEIKSKLSGF